MVYILHEQKQVLLVTSAITAVVAPPVNVLNRIIAFHNWYLVHDTILPGYVIILVGVTVIVKTYRQQLAYPAATKSLYQV